MSALSAREQTAAIVFALTYVVLAFGALRPLRLDRAGATLVGATAMVAFGVLTPQEAVAAVDFHTLALLFGMMVVVAHLRLAGFFRAVAQRALSWAHAPTSLLWIVVWTAGILSALFVNDTVCVLMTPLVLESTRAARRDPVPYLLGLAMGSNAGSVATIVGNPQNMVVASLSGLSYARFAAHLAPVAIASLLLTTLVIRLAFPQAFAPDATPAPTPVARPSRVHRGLLVKAGIVSAALLVAMTLGAPPSLSALAAASILLITRRVKPVKVYAQIDWALLTLFAGLFVVIEGVERSGLAARVLTLWAPGARPPAATLVGVTAALSNAVSNVPAVLLMKSWVPHLGPPDRTWLLVAMASTLAGNLTVVGSVANLIVVEQARGRARIGFWTYARVGIPLTLATLALGTAWLLWTGPKG